MGADASQHGGMWDEGSDFQRYSCQLVITTWEKSCDWAHLVKTKARAGEVLFWSSPLVFIDCYKPRHSTDQVVNLFCISHNKKKCIFSQYAHLWVFSESPTQSFLSYVFLSFWLWEEIWNSTLPSSSYSTLFLLLHLYGCTAEFLTYQKWQTVSDGHSRDLVRIKEDVKGDGDLEKRGGSKYIPLLHNSKCVNVTISNIYCR